MRLILRIKFASSSLFMASLFFSCVFVNTCSAQEGILKLKNNNRISVQVTASSNTSLFTNEGSFPFVDIDSIFFKTKEQKYQSTYDRLEVNKVGIKFIEASQLTTLKQQVDKENQSIVSTAQIVNSLERYRRQSQTGKGLQLVGILISTVSIAVQYSYDKKYDREYDAYIKKGFGTVPQQKYVSPAAPVIAIGVSIIGFGIDMDASRHLKLN